jgi:hypothetical protein
MENATESRVDAVERRRGSSMGKRFCEISHLMHSLLDLRLFCAYSSEVKADGLARSGLRAAAVVPSALFY